MSFGRIAILVLCLLAKTTLAQPIEQAWKIFAADQQLTYASASLTVLDAETGQPVFSANGNLGLAPASTLKTVTSATAYYLLGPNYTWKTTLGYSGSISTNGTLNGNVIITGGGDPTLGSWRYEATRQKAVMNNWVQALQQAGIKKINGAVMGDDKLFGTQTLPSGWIWQDIGNYYGAGPNSLTFRENQFDVIFSPGKSVGDPAALVRTSPAMPYLRLVNEVKTGRSGSGDNVYAFSSPYSDIVYLRGTYGIDLQKNISLSVPDPAYEAASLLQDTLRQLGISSAMPAGTWRRQLMQNLPFYPAQKVIATHTSPTLAQVVYWFNQKSVNLYGEHLLKTMAQQAGRETGTTQGTDLLREFWKDKLGIDPNSLNIIDGSGLSPGNRITTQSMARILQSVRKESWFPSYYESLPLYNGMHMKSGTINDVLGYAGYHTAANGKTYAFALLVNNYSGSASAIRQKMFRLLDTLK